MAKLQVLLALSAFLLIAGTSSTDARQGLLELLMKDPQYSKLSSALKICGALEDVTNAIETSSITFFAPDNAACDALPPALFTFLTTTPEGNKICADIILYHNVEGKYVAPWPWTFLTNLLGQNLFISGWYRKLFVNKALVEKPALIDVPQGVVHGINKVLIPPQYAYLLREYTPEPVSYEKPYYNWGWGWGWGWGRGHHW